MKLKLTPVKGTLDYMPNEAITRKLIIDNVLETYQKNGFLLIKTPILESMELLTKGDDGDNMKIMFKTIKRGEKLDLTKTNLTETDIVEEGLRYDLTVPLARFFALKRSELPYPFKAIQADEAFRAEKPQRGRYRQFTQCDIDIWGDATNLADIEIIETIMEGYKNLGLKNLLCKISSRKILNEIVLGCGYKEGELNDICVIIDKLDKIGSEGCLKELDGKGFDEKKNKELMGKLDDIKKSGIDRAVEFGAPKEEIENIKEIISVVKQGLNEDCDIAFDISIVRGQSYYTGTVFEVYALSGTFKGALSGGGRYDNMLERFLGENIPAVGATIGADRVLIMAEEEKLTLNYRREKLALLYSNEDKKENVLLLKNSLKEKYDVSIFPYPKNFKEFTRRVMNAGFSLFAKVSNAGEVSKL